MVDKLLILCEWRMDDETIAQIEKAKIGDKVHIEHPPIPQVFEDEKDGEIYLYAFTSEKKIPIKYVKEYATVREGLDYVLFVMGVYERILFGKPPKLRVDPIGEDVGEILTREQIKTIIDLSLDSKKCKSKT